jgi:hypothetical protein
LGPFLCAAELPETLTASGAIKQKNPIDTLLHPVTGLDVADADRWSAGSLSLLSSVLTEHISDNPPVDQLGLGGELRAAIVRG